MSLDPSPLSPQPTPLLNPTDPLPGRGSALVGALISVALAVLVGFVSVKAGTALLFLPQGLNAQARGVVDQLPQIQGFDYYWARSFTPAKYGYDHPDINKTNLTDEAKNYHMNLVVITITANELYLNSGQILDTHVYYQNDADTYKDQTYIDLVTAAQAAGLTPVFKLDVRVLQGPSGDPSSTNIGLEWTNYPATEAAWFNSYIQFAIHYATLAQQLGVPMMIIGHDLAFIATDTNTAYPKPKACEGFAKCYGRHDQEWRHVVNAIRNPTYTPLGAKKSQAGGGYTGRLTFAATVQFGMNSTLSTPEYSTITWWDALDIIGVDANFPLTNSADVLPSELQQVWQGKDTSGAALSTENYVDDLNKVNLRYNLPILFTAAGYESQAKANGAPGSLGDLSSAVPDNSEQLYDMQALYNTFKFQTWWLGVIWASDYPITPRSAATDTTVNGPNEANWALNTEWAGDCLQDATASCQNTEKDAGKWLRGAYKTEQLDDNFWATIHP